MSSPWQYTPYSIAGQVALVTGASSGIGKSTAWRLADLGCNLIICGRRLPLLEELRDNILKEFPTNKVLAYQIDLQDVAAMQAIPGNLPDDFKNVDILVNNAGLALGRNKVFDNSHADILAMINTNVTGLAIMSQLFTAGMKARSRGHLINISSIAGHDAYPGGSIYNATKAAVNAFSVASRMDLHDTPVRVSNICPGMTETEFTMVRHGGDEAVNDATYKDIVPLVAEDIADLIAYAVTRPLHVQLADVKVYPTNQGSGNGPMARAGPSLGA